MQLRFSVRIHPTCLSDHLRRWRCVSVLFFFVFRSANGFAVWETLVVGVCMFRGLTVDLKVFWSPEISGIKICGTKGPKFTRWTLLLLSGPLLSVDIVVICSFFET